MLHHEDPLRPIDVDKLVNYILLQSENKPVPIGNFFIIDVNDVEQFAVEHIVDAGHYERLRLSRMVYETPVLTKARQERCVLIIYGHEGQRVANVLFQRGYRAMHLIGTVAQFKQSYPSLISDTLDVEKLKAEFDKKKNNVYGGRLWRSTSASRLRDTNNANQTKRVVSAKTKTRSKPPAADHSNKPPWH